jgi:hypothetical protein
MNTKKLIKAMALTLHDEDGHCNNFVCCEARKSYEDVCAKIVSSIKKSGFTIQEVKETTGKRVIRSLEDHIKKVREQNA